ncbi:MAG: hypothetical protein OEV42_07385 [Deltaproteobacteria bacterium]|nr:hypothetical protein [Deltaproteobacteria bacterium]
MTSTQIIAAIALGLLAPPVLIMIGRKAGCGIKTKNVVVTCPKCRTDLLLKRMRNYKCPKCHEDVIFFDVKTGRPHEEAVFIKCGECGSSNFEGMKFCYKCKDELPVARKKAVPVEEK